MNDILKLGKIIGSFLLITFLGVALPTMISANSSVWTNPSYNFKNAKSIWVKPLSFSYNYDGFNLNGTNYTIDYPNAEMKSDIILGNVTEKKKGELFVFENNLSLKQSQNAITMIDDEKNTDLILTVTIKDLGWYYEHYKAYTTWQTVYKTERYRDVDSRGHVIREGTREVSHQVPEYHPAGYSIFDSAAAEFILTDSKTGIVVWKYVDVRSRHSGYSGTSYNKNGPESMLKRIFDDAFKKMPF